MRHTLLLSIAGCGLALTATAQTQLYDFNTAGQLTLTNRAGGQLTTEQATGGLSNSGYIAGGNFSTSQFTAIAQNAYSADLSSDVTFTQSVYFKTAASLSAFPTTGQDAVILGLSDSATQVPTNENLISSGLTNNYIANSIQVSNPDNSGSVDLQFKGFTTGDAGIFGPSTTVTVAADAWYFFQVDYNYRSSTDDWLFEYTLNQSTDAGIVGTELFNLTLNGAIRGNDFGASPDLYGFIGGDAPFASRIQGYDNATLVGVPEPSAYALIAGSLALAWIMVRRRS